MPAGRDTSRSLHAHFGFDPQHVLLVSTDLYLAGYTADQVPPMQKRMLDAVSAIPGVESVGLSDPLLLNDTQSTDVFSEQTTDLRPANAAANVYMFHVSPDYLRAEGTTLLGGRDFTWHDNKNAPRVAVVNREFARKIFGSAENAIGGYFKMPDGTRVQVVGIAENGRYSSLTESPTWGGLPSHSAITVYLRPPGGAFDAGPPAPGPGHKGHAPPPGCGPAG